MRAHARMGRNADLYARSDNSSTLFENYQKRYTDKLVELIVKECAKEADELGGMLFCHNDKAGAEITFAVRDCIKQQFGLTT